MPQLVGFEVVGTSGWRGLGKSKAAVVRVVQHVAAHQGAGVVDCIDLGDDTLVEWVDVVTEGSRFGGKGRLELGPVDHLAR